MLEHLPVPEIRIKVVKDVDASIDGVHAIHFKAGEEYLLPAGDKHNNNLAFVFIKEGWGVAVDTAEPDDADQVTVEVEDDEHGSHLVSTDYPGVPPSPTPYSPKAEYKPKTKLVQMSKADRKKYLLDRHKKSDPVVGPDEAAKVMSDPVQDGLNRNFTGGSVVVNDKP